MPSHVFTYGSLMFPQVWGRVVRGLYRSVHAAVAGHARFEVAGETYPGMVACEGGRVEGMLYLDVSPEDLVALDAFEGDDYRRDGVSVALESGEIVQACTYIYLRPECLLDSPWRPEAFQMERFIGTYCRDRLGA